MAAGKRAARRGRPVGDSPPPAGGTRVATPGPVRAHRVQMVDPLEAIEPAYGHRMVPGRGWVPDSTNTER